MKKIFCLISLIALFFVVQAQDKVIPTVTFTQDQSYVKLTGSTLYALNATYDSLVSDVIMNKTFPTRYDAKLKLDTIKSGTAASGRSTIKLQGRKFTTDTWTDITTVTCYGTADSSIYFTLNTEPTSTLIYDTTKIMNHASPALKSLYYATITGTATAKYYYQYRILIKRTAGSMYPEYIEWKFWF